LEFANKETLERVEALEETLSLTSFWILFLGLGRGIRSKRESGEEREREREREREK
jgi:hypothetical protein